MILQILSDGQQHCVGKPVIYLYPTHDQQVRVALTIPGIITASDPTYPANGWHVLAHPNGQLTYLGQTYHELYYEDSVGSIAPPKTGIVLHTDHIVQDLKLLTMQLGLNTTESDEFLLYWLPKLQAFHAPYLLFSVLSPAEKDRMTT